MDPRYESLNWLFCDMNSYFASVHQYLHKSLRSHPVVVVPVVGTGSACCIAASKEAKAFGVGTGCTLKEAKRLCPHVIAVEASHKDYTRVHHAILRAVDQCLPIQNVMSIDEWVCPIHNADRTPEALWKKAFQIKYAIYEVTSPVMTCSIGVGPNRFLAKMASNLKKPDGFSIIFKDSLLQQMKKFQLGDLTGVGRQTLKKLKKAGINTVEEMYRLSMPDMHAIWGSVEGQRMFHKMWGDNNEVMHPEMTKTIGHSKILPPDKRLPQEAYFILRELVYKVCYRLRGKQLMASRITFKVKFLERQQEALKKVYKREHTNDTIALLSQLNEFWQDIPQEQLIQVSVRLSGLEREVDVPLSLFDLVHSEARGKLWKTIDTANTKWEKRLVKCATEYEVGWNTEVKAAFSRVPTKGEFVHSRG